MKPRLLGLTLLVAVALAGLWVLRTERAPSAASLPPPPRAEVGAHATDLAAPRASDEAARASAMPEEPPPPIPAAATGDASATIAAGAIFGSILDTTGRPVASKTSTMRIWARGYDELGNEHEAAVAWSSYRVDGLAPGPHWVAAGAEGFRTSYGTVDVVGTEEAELDLTLKPSVQLAVRVLTREGEPHPDVVAGETGFLVPVPTLRPLPGWCFEIQGSIQSPHGVGRFNDTHDQRAAGLIGFLELDGDLPVFVSLCQGQFVLVTDLVPPGSEEVTFYLAPEGLRSRLAALRVRALDASSGEVVPDTDMMLHSSSLVMTGHRDGSGVTSFEPISPGEYGITVMADGYAWERRDVLAEPGKVTEVEIGLGASARIAGRIVDGEGRPLVRAMGAALDEEVPSIAIGRLDPGTSELDLDETMRYAPEADGRFSLSVGRGLHMLRAEGEGWAAANVLVDTRQGSVDGVEIVLRPPVDVVLRIEGGAWQGARFRVLDENEIEAERGSFAGPMPRRLELAPGTYRLVVSDASGTTLFESAFVATEGTVVVPVRL